MDDVLGDDVLSRATDRYLKLSNVGVIAIALTCLGTVPALGHSPYATAEKDLAFADGSLMTLERFYGDGIIGYDPVRIQLRDPSGLIMAHTPAGSSVAAFCPSLEQCWAFIFRPYSALPQTWQLDPAKLDLHAALSPDLGPEFAPEDARLAFEPADSIALDLLGCALLMLNAWPVIIVMLTIWFSLSYAMRWLNYRHYLQTGRRFAVISTLLGWTLLLALMSVVFVFGLFFGGLPALPIIATLLLAGLMRRWLERFLPPGWQWLRGRRGPKRLQTDPSVF